MDAERLIALVIQFGSAAWLAAVMARAWWICWRW